MSMLNHLYRINRIRLEFKGGQIKKTCNLIDVLIESDWNLKSFTAALFLILAVVLIESDWNLKVLFQRERVTRLSCINRIRLEFKGQRGRGGHSSYLVLIESDWNLK